MPSKPTASPATVNVLLDDSLFSGPSLSQAWSPEDVAAGEMAPLYPLALNSARFDPAKTTGPRPQDAAMTAAEAFAARLTAAAAAGGLSVAPGVARGRPGDAPEGGHAKVLAEVQSATVGQQVDLMLQTSDNYLAEVMGRMTALGVGRPGSSDDAIAAVLQQVKDMGIPTDSLRAADVSGLALANQGLGPAAHGRGPGHDLGHGHPAARRPERVPGRRAHRHPGGPLPGCGLGRAAPGWSAPRRAH